MIAGMRGFQAWSQNSTLIIFDRYFGKKSIKIDQSRDFNDFPYIFGHNMGLVLSKLNSETIFGILIKANLDPQY